MDGSGVTMREIEIWNEQNGKKGREGQTRLNKREIIMDRKGRGDKASYGRGTE